MNKLLVELDRRITQPVLSPVREPVAEFNILRGQHVALTR